MDLRPKDAVNINLSLVFPFHFIRRNIDEPKQAINVKLRVIVIIINEQQKTKNLISAFYCPEHD